MTQAPVETNREAARSAAAPLGSFGHQKLLSDPSYRVGVAPNVDTLYSVAWVDLAEGDLVLTTPDFGDRYYAFQFGYFDTSCHTVGQRTHGDCLGPVTIRWSPTTAKSRVDATDSGIELSCNSRYLMVAGRIMVDSASAEDVDRVHALQEEIGLVRISEPHEIKSGMRGAAPPGDRGQRRAWTSVLRHAVAGPGGYPRPSTGSGYRTNAAGRRVASGQRNRPGRRR